MYFKIPVYIYNVSNTGSYSGPLVFFCIVYQAILK